MPTLRALSVCGVHWLRERLSAVGREAADVPTLAVVRNRAYVALPMREKFGRTLMSPRPATDVAMGTPLGATPRAVACTPMRHWIRIRRQCQEQVARLVDRLDLEPIVLDQAD